MPKQKVVTPEETLESLASLSYRTGELQDFFDSACESVISLLGDGLAAVTLYRDNKKNVLALKPDSEKNETQFETHGHLSTYVVDSACTLCVEDALANPEYGKAPEGYHSYLGTPLRTPDGSVVGTLCYFDRTKRLFSPDERRAAELFAERIAIALDNYELYQQLKDHSKSLENLVEHRTSELLAARDELARKEKLAAVGEFASRITHEIRNPLATIRLALEYIENQTEEDSGLKKRAALAAGESSRLEALLSEVLLYAKPSQPDLAPVELNDFVSNFILTYESMATTQRCEFTFAPSDAITVMADRNKLTQICVNLAKNACDASDEGSVATWRVHTDNKFGFISLHNTGDTIPKAKLHQITDAFVTGKPGGFGLGLAIVKSIVDAHEGSLSVTSNETDGTTIAIGIPLVSSETTP